MLQDYIFENIFSNRLTEDDIRNGRTGPKILGLVNTGRKRYRELRRFHKEVKPTISPEEFAKIVFDIQSEIRKKKRENNGALMNVDNFDVYLEIINNDIPKQLEQALKELESVDFGLAMRLKEKKIPGTYEQASSVIDETEGELAAMIKKWEPEDPSFENTIIPVNYKGNKEEFWKFYDHLKKKGFL